MTKSKALQMRLRGRKRYLAFALKEKMDMHKLKEKIEGKINGAAIDGTAYFKIIHDKYNPKKMRGLLLVNNKNASEFIAALHAIGIQTLGTSGILKKAYHKYIE